MIFGLKEKVIKVLIENEVYNGLSNKCGMFVMVCILDLYLVSL